MISLIIYNLFKMLGRSSNNLSLIWPGYHIVKNSKYDKKHYYVNWDKDTNKDVGYAQKNQQTVSTTNWENSDRFVISQHY